MGIELTTPGSTITSGCTQLIENRCIFPASSSTPAIIKTTNSTTSHYIFITSTSHTGNFGGVSGADADCTDVAQASGNTRISTLPFRAVLVASNRYPCDSNGNCGGQSALDWPLLANTQYYNPDGSTSPLLMTNENLVFPQPNGDQTELQTEQSVASGNEFWSGIQSIKTASNDNANIVAWAYSNVNPASSTNWALYLSTCQDWTNGSVSSNGSSGISNWDASQNDNPGTNTWGNWRRFTDGHPVQYVSNTWSSGAMPTCDSLFRLVCAS